MTTTTKKATAKKRRPAANNAKLPFPIQNGYSWFEFGCKRVFLENGDLCVADSYNSSFEVDYSEDFERVMLSLYVLAKKEGVTIPPIPED